MTTSRLIATLIVTAALAACGKDSPEAPATQPAPSNQLPTKRRLSACEVVTVAEMVKILGQPMKQERVDADTCQYTPMEGFMPHVELKLEWGGAEAQAIAAGFLNRQEKGMAGRFDGIGDSAVSIGPVLYVHRGPDLVTMQLIGVDDMAAVAKAIYAIASPRLPPIDPSAAAASAAARREAADAMGGALKLVPGGDSAMGGAADFIKALAAASGETSLNGLPVDPRSGDASVKADLSPGSAVPLGNAERIPLVPGLTFTGALSDKDGDDESVFQVAAVRPDSYDLVVSVGMSTLRPDRPLSVLRRVRNDDQRGARTMRDWFADDDDEEYPGTVPHFSSAMIDDLRRQGSMPFTLIDSNNDLYKSGGLRKWTGTVTRIERDTVPVEVLVNGRVEQLPTIHAKGQLSERATSLQIELWVLDDRVNPILLKWKSDTGHSRIVKIEYPVADRAAELERALEKGETVDVYGIYFEFGSATIRPQSTPVLEEIAAIMTRHPDWSLDLAGFTDSIGNDTANLDLSRRRTAAVKNELATRFGIAADRLQAAGYGEGSPKATNDTPEGRAQNRRVEITRRRSS